MAFEASPQQAKIFNWIKKDSGSAFVEAVAGAGKTTTLVESCKIIPAIETILFLAFNKKIVEENKLKLAKAGLSRVEITTFHAAGLKVWSRIYPGVKVDANKDRTVSNNLNIPWELRAFVAALVSQAKNAAIGHDGIFDRRDDFMTIVNHFDLDQTLENPDRDLDKAVDFAIQALFESNRLSSEVVNFDDMIYCPVVSNCKIETRDWILVDEAQDSNKVRRLFAARLMGPNSRAIFVGDSRQAIYGFAGADADAVDCIRNEFETVSLPLTVSYRCPVSVVTAARRYVSHIEAHPSTPFGVVKTLDTVDGIIPAIVADNPRATDAILCRNTKPLVELAFGLIRKNIPCHIEGRDIGEALIKLATKYKVKNIDPWKDKIEKWMDKEIAKYTAKGEDMKVESLRDKVETLFVIAEGCQDVDCVVAKIRKMFVDDNGEGRPNLTLSTVHKAKGREWNRVYILQQAEYMPSKYAKKPWQMVQENNLIYVAYTRSKEELVFLG